MALWEAPWTNGTTEHADEPSSSAPAPFPISAFAAASDRLASADDVRQWQHDADGDFSLTVLPGDHAFIDEADAVELLIDELSRSLLAALAPQPATRAWRPARRSMTSFG